ncbi:MAG: 50S ribosomal protein L25 [Acidobacteria bacterium]|nr:50S ribosomal protein L25 [Acidobacteriota bacterium]MBI3473563.1 50S ribosomal protein L25 [Candidatus Solibacter usitatus]
MRKDVTVGAEPRVLRGKNEARRLRVKGMIPAVLYGAYKDSQAIGVSPKEVNGILHSKSGHNTIFNLAVAGGETTPAMVVDTQYDPVSSRLLHADFKRIDLEKRIRVSVPVATTGEAKGIKLQGGLLEVVTREVDIECLPDEIPEHFVLDVTELMIGQSVRASHIALSGSMKLLSPPEAVVAHLVVLRAEAVAEPAPAAEGVAPAEPAEPEVIKKGKKEEEGAAEPAPEKKKK